MFSVLCYFRNDLLNSLHLRKEELIGCYFPSVSKLTQYFLKLKYFFRVSSVSPAFLHSLSHRAFCFSFPFFLLLLFSAESTFQYSVLFWLRVQNAVYLKPEVSFIGLQQPLTYAFPKVSCTYSEHVPFTMQNTRDLFCKINEGHQNSQKYSDN